MKYNILSKGNNNKNALQMKSHNSNQELSSLVHKQSKLDSYLDWTEKEQLQKFVNIKANICLTTRIIA